ncbi:MAG: hypothetical protein IT383_20530 [Deltaproteobacteria bacterium]|nr:hypothetical protein [Deltaproteobacteria bacterium]
MSDTRLALGSLVKDVGGIRALIITVMPDCLMFDAWKHEQEPFEPEEVASYFGDLIRANREGLRALSSQGEDMQVTIEAGGRLVVLRELPGDFVAGFVMQKDTPLGMVRIHVKRILERLATVLPSFKPEERPKGVRVLDYLRRYAPDPHAALLRVSLRTGLPMDVLNAPEALTEAQANVVASTVRDILGLEELHV